MKRSRNLIPLIALALLATGCSTMRFHEGKGAPEVVGVEEWHHIALLGLIEASKPVPIEDRCKGNNWSDVTTERTFLNGLAGAVDGLIFRIDLWEPWTVRYVCK